MAKEFFTMEDVLEHHFSLHGEFNYEGMASNIIFDEAHTIQDIWPIKKTITSLKKVKYGMQEIDRLLDDVPYPIFDAMRKDAIYRSGAINKDGTSNIEPDDIQRHLDTSPSWLAYEAFSEFLKWQKDFIPCIDAAIEKVHEGSPEGKKALDAWRLVDALAQLCERHPNTIPVPNFINSSGPFYKLLVDMFIFFEIDTSPNTAFKGWRKHVGSKAVN